MNINKEVAQNWLENREIKIVYVGGKPTYTGRTDYYKIIAWNNNKYNKFSDMTFFISKLCNFRYNEKSGVISISGYGYSKIDHIIECTNTVLKRMNAQNIKYSIE